MKIWFLHLHDEVLEISRAVSGDLTDPWTRDEMHRWLDDMIDKMTWKDVTPHDIISAPDHPAEY